MSTLLISAPLAHSPAQNRTLPLMSRVEFETRFPDLSLVAVFPDYDADDHRAYCSQEFENAGDIYDEVTGHRYCDSDFADSLENVKRTLRDVLDANNVFTAREWQTRKAEQDRAELEEEAQDIAREYCVKFGTFEFLEALEHHEAKWQSHREGLREDGLCIGYGVSVSQWREEDEWAQDQRRAASRIRDFMAQHCPLLMAMWEEKRLREAESEATA